MEGGRRLTSPDSALAAQVFDQLCSATTLKAILAHHRHLCDILHIRPTNFPQFYPKLKTKLRSWKAQALWNKFDKRASHKCYNRGKVCANSRVLVIGAGPCGLRAAIEAQLLGAKVVVVEKRDRVTRNNVLHLWPFVIHDLRALGAKKFFGRFCAGAIDHISIRQLQCILLKVALILGVEVHENVGFEHLITPQPDQRTGWRAATSPSDHPVSQYEFDTLIGADGKRNTLDGFKRKEFRGKLAIAITANFINRHTKAEARVEEISGVAFIFNQKFFKDLYATTGIDLENIVYYKDDTHYFVMTAKKHSLIDKGVIINDYPDTAKLLSPDNVDKSALMQYAREAADFSTGCQLPQLDFAVNHYGQPDVAMFDFTSMYAAENASRIIEVGGYRLLMTLVGDSLLEPFWPTGSGCARGFLSSMDGCWAMRSLALGLHPLEVLAERESIYRLLAQTTPENLQRDLNSYTLDPHTRYPNLNARVVLPLQVRNLFTSDDENAIENFLRAPPTLIHQQELPKKRRRKEFQVQPETLLHWLQRQVSHYDDIKIENITSSFKDGMALCAIIHRYRPHLLDVHALDRAHVAANNQLAFDILERELSILPVMTGEEMAECEVPDRLAMLSYLTQIYDAFRGEIPHVKHPRIEDIKELKEEQEKIKHVSRTTLEKMTPTQKVNLLGKLTNRTPRRSRKSYHDREARLEELRRNGAGGKEEVSGKVKQLEAKFKGTHPDKKPKDLLRAIGKIEKTDWNVQQIEKKIEENRMGRGVSRRSEKVPKWSKEQFEDKFSALEKKLLAGKNGGDLDNKYADIDDKLVKLEKKIKEGSALDQGPRGANRVSAMAAHLVGINHPPPSAPPPSLKNGSSTSSQAGAGEMCHFCNKRVYLMERLNAEGKFFHRGCFRCQYCSTSLRLGNYAFDREGKFGSKFYCIQHFGLQGTTTSRRANVLREAEEKVKENTLIKTPTTPQSTTPLEANEAHNQTPERVEFENLSDCVDFEEDEWTDRNFGLSANEASDDNRSEESDSSSESEAYAEADEPGGLDPEETLRLAQDWTRKYASHDSPYSESEEEDDDEDGTTETEGDDLVRARALRKMEFPPDVAKQDTGSETEVASEDYSTTTSEERVREDNSATEISTDSEFEHDGTTPHTIPNIIISETSSVQIKKGTLEQPKQVQLITHMNGKFQPVDKRKDIKLQLKKIEPEPVTKNLPINNNNNVDKPRPTTLTPLLNPNRGDYLLNRTQSTEGIASKISLELKKKYLLGSTGISGNVRKSGSASTLDTKFKSLIDQITEQQKLLNPAPEPSPTMQAILQGADKLRLSPNSQLLSGKKELPSEHEFKHICNLKPKEEEIKKVEKEEEEEAERGRSPVHETSIVVPQFPRTEVKEVESDSLSSSSLSSSSDDEEDGEKRTRDTESVLPPKLEIHNSRGELMDMPMPDVCLTPSTHNRGRLDLVPETINKVITVPSGSGSECQGQILRQVATPSALFTQPPLPPAEPTGENSPPSPASVKDESTAACLTETEMSDWARDEDGVVSETLDDLEFNINPQFITFRKHQAAKSRRAGRGVAARIARSEDFDDEYTHVCGKVDENPPPTSALNVDNLEFMDTGDESSTESKDDNVILNKGYVQFVNPNEDELETPLVEQIPPVPSIPSLMERSRDEESIFTDTASEPVTVKDSPLQPPDATPVAEVDFDDYIEKMGGQLSAFSNVRDSLDMRKSRKPKIVPYMAVVHVHSTEQEVPTRDSPPPPPKDPPPAEEEEEEAPLKEATPTVKVAPLTIAQEAEVETPPLSPAVNTPTTNKSPTMAKKLEQLSQERIKQKNLIQEMVMNKLKSQGKSPLERKSRRSARITPTSPSRPKSELFTPLPLSQEVERAKSMNTVSPSTEEEFFTPKSTLRPRSTTISTDSTPKRRGSKCAGVPVAFSLPDITKGDALKPQFPVPQLTSNLRESARAKFKMMSDEELGLSPEDRLKKYKLKIQKHSAHLSKKTSPDSDTPKSTKEPSERKKSIIQAVSDFFHKKSPSPPKTLSSQSPVKSSDSKSETAPPVPPPPALYTPSQDESFSEEDSKAPGDSSWSVKKLKTSQRLARQAQNKRMRMAQEVQRQLEELEVRQKELEAQGVAVEKALRGEVSGVPPNEKELLDEWMRLVRAQSEARREEKLLVIRGQELELEDRHARLQSQLSTLMASTSEGEKGSEEVAKEGRILREMLEIVERKDSLSKEAERQRVVDEDKVLEQEVLKMAQL